MLEAIQEFFSLLKLLPHWLLVVVLKDFLRSFGLDSMLLMTLKKAVQKASFVTVYVEISLVLVLNYGPVYYYFL